MTLVAPPESRSDSAQRDPGSFRDPSGFVFVRDGVLYRQINQVRAADWDAFTSSGLADRLTERGWLIPATEVDPGLAAAPDAHRVIRPERIDFVSYPYEWTFGQLKDAALLTLDIASEALDAGFSLRDASAYNIQFRRGRPILIDSLSFEPLVPGRPWVGYRQFCEHFLAPLALMAKVDVRIGRFLRDALDGIPLDLASRLLPARTRLQFGLAAHVHLHSRAQRQHAGAAAVSTTKTPTMSLDRQRALLASLRSTVAKLDWRPTGTEWADYAENTSYDDRATASKEALVARFVGGAGGQVVWDLGANIGRYSRVAADQGRRVVAFDIDPAAAERNYRAVRSEGREDILPLVMDLADPSAGVGWASAERRSLLDRADADVALALALVHHLAIGRNVPLPALAELLGRLAPHVILEWVPKDDPMVQVLLASREDVFPDYHIDGLRSALAPVFETVDEAPIDDSKRVLLSLRRHAQWSDGSRSVTSVRS
jgi:hypothetical protein